MVNLIFLILLILVTQLSIGGGLYETLVIYPRWRYDVTPDNLLEKLEDSGQLNANKRFWPLVSPAQVLLSITNLIIASLYIGTAHQAWLLAALILFLNRVLTFSYFIPVMINKFLKPQNIPAANLQVMVDTWIKLSPARILIELVAWGFALKALVLMA